MTATRIDTPEAAVAAICERLEPVETAEIRWDEAAGRVLARPLLADRDSPPCDVSAMDGYAMRLQEAQAMAVPLAGEARIGRPAPGLQLGAAVKIVTGAPVPAEAQTVIRREDVAELIGEVRVRPGKAEPGSNIRRQGENLRAGGEVLPAGTLVTPQVIAAMATFGAVRPVVYRRVRVGILTTGDELLPIHATPEPWQIRDSNGPFLRVLIEACPRLVIVNAGHVPDNPDALRIAVQGLLQTCDVILLTGGVSMGDYDYVPGTISRAGATTIFHRLPIRPGHPLLAAVGPEKQLILGLPGNPLSVMTCMCRFGRAAIARLCGLQLPLPPTISLADTDNKQIDLWWYRPVRIGPDGQARLVSSRGSGDIPSAARSDGFLELPPRATGPGPYPFYRWEI